MAYEIYQSNFTGAKIDEYLGNVPTLKDDVAALKASYDANKVKMNATTTLPEYLENTKFDIEISNDENNILEKTDNGYKVAEPVPYSLPKATTSALGGIKVGNNLSIDEDGTLNAEDSYTLPIANTTTLGGVKPDGTTITIDSNGIISGASSIDKIEDIGDVALNNISNGQTLVWNATSSKWINSTVENSSTSTSSDIKRNTTILFTGTYATAALSTGAAFIMTESIYNFDEVKVTIKDNTENSLLYENTLDVENIKTISGFVNNIKWSNSTYLNSWLGISNNGQKLTESTSFSTGYYQPYLAKVIGIKYSISSEKIVAGTTRTEALLFNGNATSSSNYTLNDSILNYDYLLIKCSSKHTNTNFSTSDDMNTITQLIKVEDIKIASHPKSGATLLAFNINYNSNWYYYYNYWFTTDLIFHVEESYSTGFTTPGIKKIYGIKYTTSTYTLSDEVTDDDVADVVSVLE